MDRVTRVFAQQFQPDGTGFLFRSRNVGPAYRVTAQERDSMVADYERLTGRNTLVMMAPVVLLMLGTTYNRLFPAHQIDVVLYLPVFLLCTLVILIGGTWANFRARAAALSILDSRNPVLPALTSDERNALTGPKARLALIALAGVVCVSVVSQVLFGRHALLAHAPPILVALVPFAGLMVVAVLVSRTQNSKTGS